MPLKAKIYIAAVIACGAMVLANSTWGSAWPGPFAYGLLLVAAVLTSVVKVRLPGLNGVYSFNFLVFLFGLLEFDAGPVLVAAALSGVAQTLLNVKKRPQAVQVAFNAANLVVSAGTCMAIYRMLSPEQLLFRPALLALIAALYFVINTGLVSCILSLLQGKRLSEVSEEWYFWSFPYYLAGAACLGFLPNAGGRVLWGETWLTLVPLLYLLRFFYRLSRGTRPEPAAATGSDSRPRALPKAAQAYVGIIVALGLSVLMYALPQWKSDDPLRFAAFLILALAASAWKVRLPGLEGTISLNFVILLVAVVELNLSEAAVLCAGMGVMQSVWKAARKPQLHQVLFNACVLVLSGSLSGLVCRWLSGRPVAAPLMVVLPLAVLMSYLTNSLLVATVICLAQGKSLSSVWQHCNFWSSAYYMVGGAGAGLMIGTMRAAGWVPSMMVLPLMMLVYVSYRAHVSAATTPKLATA